MSQLAHLEKITSVWEKLVIYLETVIHLETVMHLKTVEYLESIEYLEIAKHLEMNMSSISEYPLGRRAFCVL